MIRDQFYVSLRTMTSRLGGEIMWNATAQTATIKIGDLQADMNMSKHLAVVKRVGGERAEVTLDVVMSDGSIQLNLRDLLEILNLKVAGYVDDGQKREVTVE